MSFVIYDYRIVGEELVSELLRRMEAAEPFALLGPPGAGKRHLLTKLRGRLHDRETPWIAVILRDHQRVSGEEDLLRQIQEPARLYSSEKIDSKCIERLKATETLEDFFAVVAQVDRAHKGIPLVFANLDGLSDDLLFRLLSLIRARQDGALAPIRPTYALTGERLLLEFVGSETSPIQPQFQYVIQAHDEETITHFCKKRIEAIQLQFHSEWTADEAIRFLYDLAQGDLNIIRAVLLAASEYRLEYDREREMYPGVRRSFFEQSLRRCATVPLYGLKLFQLARQTIQHHEDMLDLVEVLVDKLHGCSETKGEPLMSASCWNAASVSLNETRWAHYLRKPTPLELTGLVKRDSKTLTLKFSSRYAADFAYRYFTMQCRGDFLLRQRRFPEAIDRYRRTPDSGRERRPRNLTDFQIVRDGVHRLCRHFAETAVFPDSNGKFFAVFCDIAKYLLGFHDATMWRYRAEGGVWENVYNQVSHERSDILDVAPKHALALNNQTPKLFIERSKWPHVSAYVVSFDYPAKDSVAIVLEDAETSPRVSEWRSLAAARLAHHFLLAWCHSRDRHYLEQQRTKLGTALAHMFREETIEKSLQVLAKYLKEEVSAHAVRLFLAQNGNPNVITSRFQVGFESAERARDFDAGGLTLSRDRDPTMFGAADSRKPTMFRWIPVGFTPQPKGERPLSYKKVTDHPYAERVERKHGDYWIDFPLFKDGEFFGKLTLAFRSNQPPPDGAAESLENVFELLAQHIGNLHENATRFAELKSIHRKAIAVTAHDLATRIGSLTFFGSEFIGLARSVPNPSLRKDITDLALEFKQRLDEAFETTKLAKEWLAPIALGTEIFPIGRPIEKSLPTLDDQKGTVMLEGDTSILVMGREAYIDAVFRELISDSSTMFPAAKGLVIGIRITRKSEAQELQIDYWDNGPGVAAERKEKIFEYFYSHRPGQAYKGMGLGLGRVREIINSHGGDIREVGKEGEGVHFRIVLPIHNPRTTR